MAGDNKTREILTLVGVCHTAVTVAFPLFLGFYIYFLLQPQKPKLCLWVRKHGGGWYVSVGVRRGESPFYLSRFLSFSHQFLLLTHPLNHNIAKSKNHLFFFLIDAHLIHNVIILGVEHSDSIILCVPLCSPQG